MSLLILFEYYAVNECYTYSDETNQQTTDDVLQLKL